ncbi:MAG: tRNA (adenosine(37)-N6)-threonylcarbamoyltransferase complex ATPase subunit type 1 TsaE [Chitinophagaceae bacterium]|nr:MAG: ATPase [Bacteroidetes bacterium OLB11]MCC6447573.1 tRNA (adenosine(37)-N6)-threonylcarbamoyltransferase complex ATPase subunit type 1 TsaE [Chitinophagaceae bacterium]HMN33035.1 tRNA (adenosine(37)-N6)-threonylcarbamoyltransferase complex ATPase subunit type 1 TsaE [Chitinophagaceae bacterium]
MFQKRFTLSEMSSVVKAILNQYERNRCFAFYAEMGSGKTTIICEICKQLGVTEQTSSPTYSIINEYMTTNGARIFHIDCYRLKGIEDAIQTGVEDIIKSNEAYCFIEWPQQIENILPKDCIRFSLKMISKDEREIAQINFENN